MRLTRGAGIRKLFTLLRAVTIVSAPIKWVLTEARRPVCSIIFLTRYTVLPNILKPASCFLAIPGKATALYNASIIKAIITRIYNRTTQKQKHTNAILIG